MTGLFTYFCSIYIFLLFVDGPRNAHALRTAVLRSRCSSPWRSPLRRGRLTPQQWARSSHPERRQPLKRVLTRCRCEKRGCSHQNSFSSDFQSLPFVILSCSAQVLHAALQASRDGCALVTQREWAVQSLKDAVVQICGVDLESTR